MKRGLCLILLGIAVAAQAADLSLSIQPLFEGRSQINGPTPYIATVANRGPDAVGRVVVRIESSGNVLHPVNLPRGSTKRVTLILPVSAQYSQVQITLDTDQGRVSKQILPQYGYGGQGGGLLIGGSSGDMAFLNPQPTQHVGADAAPERPILYSGFDFVVLGESAERMSDAATRALQIYLVAGGKILLVGGASSPLLHDPRWVPLLPMHPTGVRDVRVPTSVEKLWGRPMPETPITLTLGKVADSSQVRATGPVPLVVERSAGQGLVVQFAFNPFDEPLRTWSGLTKLFARYLPPGSGSIQMLGRDHRYEDFGNSGMPTSAIVVVPGSPPQPLVQDAFTLEMPPWSKMLTLLIAYALIVVPVNLLVLRRMRKSELAWVTAPLVSLGFAGAFFSLAGDLYKTPLSTASTGSLIWDTRLPEGYFSGTTQMFVPRGGRYDLELEGIDYLGTTQFNDYSMRASRATPDLVDTGTYSAPNARFANLTYQSVVYGQIVPTQSWLRTTSEPLPRRRIKLKITNGSPHVWSSLVLQGPNGHQTLPKLLPGATWTLAEPISMTDNRKPTRPPLQLTGVLEGFRPGPQLGNDVTRLGNTVFNAAVTVEERQP